MKIRILLCLIISVLAFSELMSENRPWSVRFMIGVKSMRYSLSTWDGYQQTSFSSAWTLYDDPFHFRVYEYDTTYCSVHFSSVKAKPTFGLNLGFAIDRRLSRHLDLQFFPSVSFSSLCIQYDMCYVTDDGRTDLCEYLSKDKNVDFFEMSLLLKYRILNDKLYFIGGADFQWYINGRQRNHFIPGHSYPSTFFFTTNISADFGVGVCFKNRKELQLRMSMGLLNVIKGKNKWLDDCTCYFPFDNVRVNQLGLYFLF